MEADFRPLAVWNWLKGCPYIGDMYFALGENTPGGVTLLPVTALGDRTITRFIDGSEIRQCDFALVKFDLMTATPNDEGNMRAQEDVENIARWIDEQGALRNYPAFPQTRVIQKLCALPTETGFIAGVNGASARFLLQFRIEYYCEE